MKSSRLIVSCVALLLSVFSPACTHTQPSGREMTEPHETVRLVAKAAHSNAYAAGPELKTALEAYTNQHGQLPVSVRELGPACLRGYSMTQACEDGSTSEQTLVAYRRTSPANGTFEVRNYMQGGGLRSLQRYMCRNGQWSDDGTSAFNIAPRLP